jgi:hypothetical protein
MAQGEVVRRSGSVLSRTEQRQLSRELEVLDHQTELAEQQVASIQRVVQRATCETMLTGIVRQKAEQIAPDGAEFYAMYALAGAVETTRVINSMHQPRRGCR